MKETATIQYEVQQTDQYLADPHEQFMLWLSDNGLKLPKPREFKRSTLKNRLKDRDLWKTELGWIQKVRAELTGWGLKGLSAGVASEIVWRLVEQRNPVKVYESKAAGLHIMEEGPAVTILKTPRLGKSQQLQMVSEVQEIEGMEYLPDYMRWAVMHPGLNFGREVKLDDEVKEIVNHFEEVNPCPSQVARNAFERYRGDAKAIDGLLRECSKLYAQDQRSRKAEIAEVEDIKLAEEHISSIRKRLGMA